MEEDKVDRGILLVSATTWCFAASGSDASRGRKFAKTVKLLGRGFGGVVSFILSAITLLKT